MTFYPPTILAAIAGVVWLAWVVSQTSRRIRRRTEELARRRKR